MKGTHIMHGGDRCADILFGNPQGTILGKVCIHGDNLSGVRCETSRNFKNRLLIFLPLFTFNFSLIMISYVL
jgi:hypothetical protein